MANWNLSVDLRGQGNLAQTLRDSARDARSLGQAAATARTQISQLGTTSSSTSRDLQRLATQAGQAVRQLRDLASQADRTRAQLDGLSGGVRITAQLDDQTGPAAASIRSTVDDLQRLGPIRIGAQIDDQTTAGATGTRAAVAGLAALGPVRIDAQLHDQTTAAAAAIRATVADLQTLGPVRIGVDFDADATQIAAAAAALRSLNTDTTAASRALLILSQRARAAADDLDRLRSAAIASAVGLGALAAAASHAHGQLDDLSTRARTLRSDLDGLNNTLTTTGGNTRRLGDSSHDSASGMDALLKGAISLAPALIPIAASTLLIAGQLATAGAAIGAFGVAIGAQIVSLTAAAEAEKKYDEAVAQSGQYSKEAAQAAIAQQQTLKGLPPATQLAAAAYSNLKETYQDWSDSLAGDTMPVATKGMALLGGLVGKLSPLVRTSSTELSRMETILAGGMQSPGLDKFLDKANQLAGSVLDKVVASVAHLSQALATGQANGAIGAFLKYAQDNGPLVASTMKNVSEALGHIGAAAANAGPGMLTLVNALAGLLAALPTGVLTALISLYSAFKLIGVGSAALGPAVTRITALRTTLTAMRAASVAAGGGLAGLQAAFASLSTGAKVGIAVAAIAGLVIAMHELSGNNQAPIAVDRLSSSLTTLARTGKLTGELKTNLTDMSESIAMVSKSASNNKILTMVSDFGSWIGISTGPGISKAKENVDAWDKSMANLVAGGKPKEAAAQFDILKKSWLAGGGDMKGLNKATDDYHSALADAATEQAAAAASMGLFGKAAQDAQAKLDAQKQSADGLRQSIQALNDVNRSALGGMVGFEAAIDAASDAAKKSGSALTMSGGQLNLNSSKARDAASALNDLAAKTEEAAASSREAGGSWQSVNAIYARGHDALVKTAMQMGLTSAQAGALAKSILTIPATKATKVEMRSEDAVAGLDRVMAAMRATPNSKSITVGALTADATALLKAVGYTVQKLPNGQVKITAQTGAAISGIGKVKGARDALKGKTLTINVPAGTPQSQVSAIQRAIDSLHGKTITNTIITNAIHKGGQPGPYAGGYKFANGGISRYANGGIRYFADGGDENHVAQIAKPGDWRVWAEDETGGESYIPLSPSKRPRSRAITEETVRRLGGDPRSIQWNADGNVTDWTYDPASGSLYSSSDATSAAHKTKKVKVKSKGKTTTKDVDYFDEAALESKLKSNSKANQAWAANLSKVADRAGSDVADALAAMGADGIALTKKMATGSTKYVNEMAASLRGLAATAKASLTDYTRQLTAANKVDSTFQKNLALLAGQGYGDLAKQLASQNDQAATELAAAAVKDKKKASSANTAAKTANATLTPDQVSELVAIIAAVKTSTTGIHAVADTTGLGEDEIITVATKARSQISSSLGSRATKLLADLTRAGKGMSYADGGIRPGMYATQNGIVRFAEPETHGEAYIPLGANKRAAATSVLHDVAGRFGLGLTNAAATRPVVVMQQAGDTHVTVTAVRSDATASDIGSQVGRSVRRARRGGVAARA
ncbi:hypothetical protein ACIPW9_36095 [Streptomyces sp. NPDC090052]|uniref:hypothetical protein n=1 Tax=Streptomyces sp. NPDC090052 TaxID=3365931 RepID=UPI003822C896